MNDAAAKPDPSHSPDLIFLTTADARRMEAAEEFGAWAAPGAVFGVSPILK